MVSSVSSSPQRLLYVVKEDYAFHLNHLPMARQSAIDSQNAAQVALPSGH
jgi:hypothetical protein